MIFEIIKFEFKNHLIIIFVKAPLIRGASIDSAFISMNGYKLYLNNFFIMHYIIKTSYFKKNYTLNDYSNSIS